MSKQESLSVDELSKENHELKQKLALVEANYERAKTISVTQSRVESIWSDSLKRELQFFQLILENMTNILLLLDVSGNFAYVSNTFLKKANIPDVSLINGKYYKNILKGILSEENLKDFANALDKAIFTKSTISIEEEMKFNNIGESFTYSILITPMIDEWGETTGIMALFNDITEINNALESAKQANLAKSEFLANMSHEIRTPLNAILGMANIAQSTTDMDKIQYSLTKINDSSGHLLGVIKDILDMSKIESNHLELSNTEFVFEKMLLRIVDVMQFKFEEKNITFDLHYDPKIPYSILSDEQRLAQVIMNLLSNALKFTPQNGNITLRADVDSCNEDDYVLRVSIQDNGIGITEEQKPRLFKVFSQADNSISRRYGGTGLGLAISKTIVEMMDGRIWFDSEEGSGSTFHFMIAVKSTMISAPTADDKTLRDSEGADSEIAVTETIDDFSDKTIMLVDDVEINREIIISLLESTNINIICAENGMDATEKYMADNGTIELIFMDVQMPLMDGYEATGKIRASGKDNAKTIPIIAMTANVFKEDVERCLASGMNDHVGKPVNIDEVIGRIRKFTTYERL